MLGVCSGAGCFPGPSPHRTWKNWRQTTFLDAAALASMVWNCSSVSTVCTRDVGAWLALEAGRLRRTAMAADWVRAEGVRLGEDGCSPGLWNLQVGTMCQVRALQCAAAMAGGLSGWGGVSCRPGNTPNGARRAPRIEKRRSALD